MKIRQGFISNSSSTSFLMVGMKFPWPENKKDFIKTVLCMTDKEIEQEVINCDYYKDAESISERDIENYCTDWLYDINFKKNGFDIAFNAEIEDCIIVGRELLSIYNYEVRGVDPNLIEDAKTLVEELRNKMDLAKPIKLYIGSITG